LDDEDFLKEIQPTIDESINEDNLVEMGEYIDTLKNSFDKMKEEKLIELKSKREKTTKEISKIEFQLNNNQQNLENLKGELKLLDDRIDDIQPIAPSIGYYFNVSERQNETVVLDVETEKIIKDKVSKIKSINVENFMKLFTDGEFRIKLSKKTDDGFEIVEDYKKIDETIIESLSPLSLGLGDNHLIYMGDLTWSQIVNKLIKLGFEQNPDFDKHCDSNSYHSKIEKPKVNF
jgi:DNA repair exonuclease SbcCD ATPase subunit